jgi:hypothetical protein
MEITYTTYAEKAMRRTYRLVKQNSNFVYYETVDGRTLKVPVSFINGEEPDWLKTENK